EDKPLVIPAAALRLYDNLTEHTLANGLKVYLLPVSGSPTVTMMTALKVGSCDEDKHATGLAHYLEHLLFKGTKRFRPGDIDRMTQRSGGSNNAYTNYDITNYHFDFASDRWETALEIEAERMRGTAIDEAHEFQQEKGAVIEELARNEDSPWDLEEKALLPMLFGKNSPYGHPIIGEREHVRDASAETIIEFYNKWYHPNNCHLILVGGFEPTQALSRIKAKLESIPRTELPSRKPWIEELPQRPARTEFTSKFPTARMLLGYVTVPQGHADESALDMASMLLASGKTSRLYKRLVLEERMAVEVGCSHIPGRYPGYFQVMVELLPGKDRAKAEKIVLDEINKLADTLVPVAELRRCQRLLISQSIFNRESVHNLAESIAQIVVHQSVEALKKQFHLWAAVTPADVQRVVKQYLPADKPVVVWSVPKDEKLVAAPGEPASPKRMLSRHSNQQASSTPVALSLKQAEQITLPNGLTLIFFHNPRLPIVVTSALIKKVRQFEPEAQAGLAQLTGSLYEEGTTRRTGEQIADAIESVGGTLRLSAQGGTVKTLSDNAALGLELLLDSLLNPTFSEADFQRMKEEQLSEIADAQEQPLSRAAETFNAEIYGKHYKGRPARGTMETVEKLTPDDCRRFHKTVMVPENVTLAIVGDFNQGEMLALVNKFTDGWHGRLEEGLPQPELKIAESATTRLISMPKAAQLQFLMGHLGIPRNH
ncbi:MAG TPA: pitrilysin family protein, partial [Gemmatales bacterium]|nr:pitrilysin family protein [Gemmatales bacterium]